MYEFNKRRYLELKRVENGRAVYTAEGRLGVQLGGMNGEQVNGGGGRRVSSACSFSGRMYSSSHMAPCTSYTFLSISR